MAEFLLYRLWDLGLKVGQSTRSLNESIKLAKSDFTIRTTLLETRPIWGSERLAQELEERRQERYLSPPGERLRRGQARRARCPPPAHRRQPLSARAQRQGGQGRPARSADPGLARRGFSTTPSTLDDLVQHDVLTPQRRCSSFLARAALPLGRALPSALSDRPRRGAADLRPAARDRAGAWAIATGHGSSSVERFMKRYYLVAKEVGTLTRIVCAALEEQHQAQAALRPAALRPRPAADRRLHRAGQPADRARRSRAVRARAAGACCEYFHLAQERELDIHPMALTALARNLRRVDSRCARIRTPTGCSSPC